MATALPALASGCSPSGGNSSADRSGGVTIDIQTAEPEVNAETGNLAVTAPQPAAPPAVPAAAKLPTPTVPTPPKAQTTDSKVEPKALEKDTPAAADAIRQEVPAAKPAAAPAPPTTEAAAKLPLSNAVVARTIERIGYSCGEVTSSSAVADASGSGYRIVCSSGASYRATNVAGHLRFRKWEAR